MNKKDIRKYRKRLIHWYTQNQRKLPWRQTDDPYRIWVSEVMLQQTRVDTVIPYYLRFVQRFPDLPALARADLQEVLKTWEGMGYYARARNLHRGTREIVNKHNGVFPEDVKAFRALPGVGDYISAAVFSIAFNRPHGAVDGNVKRVLARLLMLDAPVNKSSSNKTFRYEAEKLLDRDQPGIYNQALMELGALVCTPRHPDCAGCPLRTFCRACAKSKVDIYPHRLKRRPVPEYHIAAGVVCKNGRVLITRRRLEGLLGGLWEFPGGKVGPNEQPQSACVREIKEEVDLNIEVAGFLTRIKHVYTHFRIVMDVYHCRYVSGRVRLNGPVDHRWIKLKDIDRYPFPKANHKFIPLLKEEELAS
ncbi:MAG: A/G-specific adenine glycosylase [Deltaproteobacteria bacterium]|nr:MAG: A/G-specific adenine glycosylase [Deltaproteobacteria bacterium]